VLLQQPQITLVSPLDHANVGSGVSVDVNVTVNMIDKVTNAQLYGASVTVEGIEFKQDLVNPLLWSGKVTVPKDGLNFEVVVETSDKTIFTLEVTYQNKTGALKPLVMGINPGSYVMVYDPQAHRIAKINLINNLWTQYLQDPRLAGTEILFDFNSGYQHAYTMIDSDRADTKRLVAAGIADGVPAVFFAGTVTQPTNITYDGTKKRVLVVSKTSSNPDKFSVLGIPTGTGVGTEALGGGFANGKSEVDSFQPASFSLAWNVPADVLKGPFKSFAYYRKGATFLIADERVINGSKRTVIQAFAEGSNGIAVKKFEKEVGPDISNITVNNGNQAGSPGGFAYVAENKSSLLVGKLKAIDLNDGTVTDLGEIRGNTTVANYSELRIDNTNQLLYIGDSVSDSIYEVKLSDKTMRELPILPAVPAGSAD
jgi:hypothetical protein